MIAWHTPSLTLLPVDAAAFSILRSWFDDPELSSRYQRPNETWLSFVLTDPRVHAWIAKEGDTIVGQVQLDVIAPGLGAVGFYVAPALRRRGYGQHMLDAMLSRPEARRLRRIIAETEPDNVASRRCLEGAGFTLRSPKPGSDGFLTYEIAAGRRKL